MLRALTLRLNQRINYGLRLLSTNRSLNLHYKICHYGQITYKNQGYNIPNRKNSRVRSVFGGDQGWTLQIPHLTMDAGLDTKFSHSVL